jgi:hypothetical protein
LGLHPFFEGRLKRKTLVCSPLDSMTSAECAADLNSLSPFLALGIVDREPPSFEVASPYATQGVNPERSAG